MEDVKALSDALKRFNILRHVEGRAADEPVEWETAYAICHIISSLRAIEQTHIPALLTATSADLAGGALHDLREELRHVAYHLQDSAYLSVVVPST